MNALPAGLSSTVRVALAASPVRYLITGAALFAVDLAIFMTLARVFGVSPAIAQAVSRTTGGALGFVAHRMFTFAGGAPARSLPTQGAGYLVGTGVNLLISPLLVAGLVHLSGGLLLVPKLIAEVILVCETYLLLRWIFRTRDPKE